MHCPAALQIEGAGLRADAFLPQQERRSRVDATLLRVPLWRVSALRTAIAVALELPGGRDPGSHHVFPPASEEGKQGPVDVASLCGAHGFSLAVDVRAGPEAGAIAVRCPAGYRCLIVRLCCHHAPTGPSPHGRAVRSILRDSSRRCPALTPSRHPWPPSTSARRPSRCLRTSTEPLRRRRPTCRARSSARRTFGTAGSSPPSPRRACRTCCAAWRWALRRLAWGCSTTLCLQATPAPCTATLSASSAPRLAMLTSGPCAFVARAVCPQSVVLPSCIAPTHWSKVDPAQLHHRACAETRLGSLQDISAARRAFSANGRIRARGLHGVRRCRHARRAAATALSLRSQCGSQSGARRAVRRPVGSPPPEAAHRGMQRRAHRRKHHHGLRGRPRRHVPHPRALQRLQRDHGHIAARRRDRRRQCGPER